jgi:hypothetical protein
MSFHEAMLHNTLQHAATHFDTLQCTATCTATHCNTLPHALQHIETRCNTLQHCNTWVFMKLCFAHNMNKNKGLREKTLQLDVFFCLFQVLASRVSMYIDVAIFVFFCLNKGSTDLKNLHLARYPTWGCSLIESYSHAVTWVSSRTEFCSLDLVLNDSFIDVLFWEFASAKRKSSSCLLLPAASTSVL